MMEFLATFLLTFAAFIFAIRFYVKSAWRRFTEDVDMLDKTVIVTGGNAGIGKALAKEFAIRNARVILACRSLPKAEIARKDIMDHSAGKHAQVKIMFLDLSSLDSVRQFSKEIASNEKRLDILVNNAGVNGLPVTITEDNMDITYQTNYFSHFLLTMLLLDLLKQSGPGSRIVNIGSLAHRSAVLDLDRISPRLIKDQMENKRMGWLKQKPENLLYFNSKLMNLMFTFELDRRLGDCGVTVNCVHPGVVRTRLLSSNRHPIVLLFTTLFLLISKSTNEGCQGILHCALSPSLTKTSGKYFTNCNESEDIHPMALDRGACKKLWDISEALTKLNKTK